ncbi:hypothetical protein BST86_05455 [Nonlabens agnitus]|uniref:Uncharacterized protein n=2 Tax=Nonlabens agnitus TaxID=870484 RepID=A0A2S9WSY1_9FLAO|nr:hypothetical protein BST86_05455 [Nonlabens agnitus]
MESIDTVAAEDERIYTTPVEEEEEEVEYLEETFNNYEEEYSDQHLEFVYEAFDIARVLERLQLGELIADRTVSTLLNADLREGDTVVQDILETSDGTFDIYKLVDEYDNELAYFYFESDVISTIEIVHPGGVPDAMIRPGLTFEQLHKTYENPVAYGSEIEARVFVQEDGVSFRMDTSYGVYEPIDLEDDIEILYIQF